MSGDSAPGTPLIAPVHVSGAGPAGLSAAITLASGGRAVLVHERAPDVGHRFHHDFQGLENWTTDGDVLDELASIGIRPDFDYASFRETTLFDADGREHTYRSDRPLFHLVRRGEGKGTLDRSLARQAQVVGAELRFNDPVQHLRDGGIVAEGPHGSDVIAVGYVFDTDAADGAYAALAERLAPGGYAYLLVHGGRGTLASCMFADFHHERDYLARATEFFRERVSFAMRDARRFGGTGNFRPFRSVRRGQLLYVGEAAGFQDALWGFGMRYAMVSGYLAARALLAGAPGRYDADWRARFGGNLRAGAVNRFLIERLGERGYRMIVRRLDRAPDPRAWLGRRYRSSIGTDVLYSLARRMRRWPHDPDVCVMEGCDCTWCRCNHSPPAS